MNGNSYVVVFPSAPAGGRLRLLASNIRRILEIKDQGFDSISRDGPVITVDARDPVFASSAISLLFGIGKVAIAVRAGMEFEQLVRDMAEIGSNLLLGGDRFLVRVDGAAKGFIPRDLEIAATSAIIERSGAKPGTEERHDKVLYTFLARDHAYVCIFSDNGLGGLPYGSQGRDALCCIFDELSAVSCLETIRQGYRTKMIVCYRKPGELAGRVRIVTRIIPRTLSRRAELDFFRVDVAGRGAYASACMDLAGDIAEERGISHVSLPVSPLLHPADFVDERISGAVRQGLRPVLPLGGMDEGLARAAREIGLELRMAAQRLPGELADRAGILRAARVTCQRVTVRTGPNSLHDILDSLQGGRSG